MAAPQQFSLKWNNYSHHIVSALEELRLDDELTDVTLTCGGEGQRVKAHKLLLSACSVFFKETFKENPCKHPVVILKGVNFQDLRAVVQFMYNGQVNVSQERLPTFLQTAEILQIKGLTDSTSAEKEEATIPKKRPQAYPSQASTSIDSLSVRQESDTRPPTPKRKRVLGGSGTFVTTQNSTDLPGSASVISSGGNITAGSGVGSHNASSNQSNAAQPSILSRNNSDNSADGLPFVKYEDQEDADEESQYDRSALSEDNDNSLQDNGKDLGEGGDSSTNAIGIHNRSTNGAGDRRRYTLQPSNDQAPGVVDATNGIGHHAIELTRDLIGEAPPFSSVAGDTRKLAHSLGTTNGITKFRHRLASRSLSSGSTGHQQQEDRVIKYAPLHTNSQDSRSNSSHEGDIQFVDDCSESPQGTDEDDEFHQQRRPLVTQKGRTLPNLVKANHIISHLGSNGNGLQHQQRSGATVNGNLSILRSSGSGGNVNRGTARGGSAAAETLTVSSPSDMSTPSFSLTQQLLQQNVLSLISSNGTEAIKSNSIAAAGVASSSSSRVSAIAVPASGGTNNVVEHPIVAPYVCDICGKRYVHHRSLNDHKKSHTGATRCPVCNKSFSKVANMRAHYSAQHTPIDMDSEDLSQQNGHVSVK